MRKVAFPTAIRPRTVVTTDPELDDLNSMIRLLTHAGELDLRGLVYAGSAVHSAGSPDRGIAPHRWPAPGDVLHIDQAIDAYAQVEDTLRIHDPAFPTAAHLRSLVRMGNVAWEGEMDEVTPGSALIADLLRDIALTPDGAVEADSGVDPGAGGAVVHGGGGEQGAADGERPAGGAGPGRPADATRPLFLQAWGGISTIARALRTVAEELGGHPDWAEFRRRITDRVVITSFGEQDSTLASYIRPEWPGLEHREVATKTWGYMTRFVLLPQDLELVSSAWMRANVSARGPLGAAYRVWGDGRQMAEGFDAEDYFWTSGRGAEELREEGYTVWCPVQEPGAFISEGDTSNVTPLIPNGLSSWQDATFGGWGGRQVPHPTLADTMTSDMRFELPGLPQPDCPQLVVDHAPDGTAPDEYHQTRWWRALQNEFAARLAWSVTPRFEDANHPPVIRVEGGPDRAEAPEGGLALSVVPGQRVELAATASDPDGDDVRLIWWAYPEAGPQLCPMAPVIEDDGAGHAAVMVPAQAETGQQIHVIVEGTDSGTPALTRYQRVVLTVA